jgi:hypothetical protein
MFFMGSLSDEAARSFRALYIFHCAPGAGNYLQSEFYETQDSGLPVGAAPASLGCGILWALLK